MASRNNSDLRSAPSVLDTASAPTFARVLDFLAGPLALVAAGLTFFAAYDLTVNQPPDLFTGVQPAFAQTVAAHQVTAPVQTGSSGVVNGRSRVSMQESPQTLSMRSGPAPKF